MKLQNFERFPRLAAWVERLANTNCGMNLIEWQKFTDALNDACAPSAPVEDDMRALGASDAACYHWPEDTELHRACREAYCRGAADCRPASPPADARSIRENSYPALTSDLAKAIADDIRQPVAGDVVERENIDLEAIKRECEGLEGWAMRRGLDKSFTGYYSKAIERSFLKLIGGGK